MHARALAEHHILLTKPQRKPEEEQRADATDDDRERDQPRLLAPREALPRLRAVPALRDDDAVLLLITLPVAAFGRAAASTRALALDDAELVDAAVAVDSAAYAGGTIPDPLLVGVRAARLRSGLGLAVRAGGARVGRVAQEFVLVARAIS